MSTHTLSRRELTSSGQAMTLASLDQTRKPRRHEGATHVDASGLGDQWKSLADTDVAGR